MEGVRGGGETGPGFAAGSAMIHSAISWMEGLW